MKKSKEVSKEEFNKAQQDRLSVKRGEVKFINPKDISKRITNKYKENKENKE